MYILNFYQGIERSTNWSNIKSSYAENSVINTEFSVLGQEACCTQEDP